jgi:hypothetical protein
MDTYLIDRLHLLNLQVYIATLQKNGYTSWDQLGRVSEEELERLGFKLGHRRRLQREIASMKGYSYLEALPPQGMNMTQLDDSWAGNLLVFPLALGDTRAYAALGESRYSHTHCSQTMSKPSQCRNYEEMVSPATQSSHRLKPQGQHWVSERAFD